MSGQSQHFPAQLKATLDSYGLELDVLAQRIGIRGATLEQYLNDDRHPKAAFISKFERELDTIREESLQILRAKNTAQLGQAKFHLYYNVLPSLPINKLPASPVFKGRPQPGQLPDYEVAMPWDRWSEEAWRRATGIYTSDRALGQGDHVTVLMGSPGSGKTTELKRLLLHLQLKGMTCIFVPLSIYNSPGPEDLFEAARIYYVEKLAVRLPMRLDRLLEQEVGRKRLVLFLDSLDEADAPHRKKIVGHANALGGSDERGHARPRVPIFFSSRYIPLRLDLEPSMSAAQHWHLAGLKPEQALAHIETLRTHLEERGNDTTLVVSMTNRMRTLGQHMRSLMNAYANRNARGADMGPHDSTTPASRAARTFVGLSHPLFLHLHIGLCLERGVAEWSMDSIIGRYVEFLLGRWIDSRTENPEQEQRQEGRASLERALAYLGFYLTLCEHVGQSSPSPEDVEKLLVDYFKKVAPARSTDEEELSEFVRDQLLRARTAEIFEADSSSHVRFGAPADVLREYHVAQFIEQSTFAEEAAVYPGRRPRRGDQFPAIKDSGYSMFLTNPNVRFLEPGMVLYFKSLFENARGLAQVHSRFERAMITPPLKPSLCGCTKEELKKILPLNLMFLGRALEGNVSHRYRILFEELHGELNAIFDKTNFATVYDALLPIVRPLLETSERNLDIDSLNPNHTVDLEKMDELWRRLPDAKLLTQLAGRITPIDQLDWNTLPHRQQIVLRRIVYQLRYHAETFDEDTLDWLQVLHRRCGGYGVADTVLTTGRVIRNTLSPHIKLDWSYFDSAENLYRENIAEWERGLLAAWDRVGRNAMTFVKDVATDDDRFPFRAMQRTSAALEELISRDEFDSRDAVLGAIQLLDSRQDPEQRGKTLRFLRLIAGTYRGQQLMMPSEYRINSIDQAELDNPRYRPEDLLITLFALVKPHLANQRFTEDTAGGDPSSVGGLQLYDFVVETIWAILWNSPYAHDSREEI